MKFVTVLILLFFSVTIFSVDMDDNKISKIPDGKKIENAGKMIASMESVLSDAYNILKRTRKEKDIVKLNCVNESIRKIKGLLKRSKEDLMSLQEAVAKDDKKSSNYYYTKILLANDNIKQASVEVLSCEGTITIETEGEEDKPKLYVKFEGIVVDEDYVDNTQFEQGDLNISLEPVEASPYF